MIEHFKETTREFANRELNLIASEIDEKEEIDPNIIGGLEKYGYLSMILPEEEGGVGANLETICMVVEELAKVCASTAITLVGHLTGSIACILGGTEEQKQKHLYPGSGKQNLFAISISEPGAGSDVSSISASAQKKDDGYVLNGNKRFVTNGGLADVYVIIARTDSSDRKKGLSAFVVPKNTPGLTIGKKEKKMGLRGSATTDLHLDNLWVSEEHLLGEEGDGFDIVMKTMDQTRVVVAAHALGIASGALSYALTYVKEREQFGKPIHQFQGLQFILADMAIKEETAKSMVYFSAKQVIKNHPMASYYSSIAKTAASDAAMFITNQAVQVMGGAGYMRDYPVERMMRDAKVTQIFEGTNQIQRIIIAKQRIGRNSL